MVDVPVPFTAGFGSSTDSTPSGPVVVPIESVTYAQEAQLQSAQLVSLGVQSISCLDG